MSKHKKTKAPDDPIESTRPVPESTVGAHPSFVRTVGADGVVQFEPTAHYLPNMAAELINRGATRVDSVRGVKDILFHHGLAPLGPDGTLGVADEGEMAVSLIFDPTVRDAGLTLIHRAAGDAREMATSSAYLGAPFLPTLADMVGEVTEALDTADLEGRLLVPYLDAVQIGNHLFAKVGDGVGGVGGYFRLVVERIDEEQFALMLAVAGRLGAVAEEGPEEAPLDDERVSALFGHSA